MTARIETLREPRQVSPWFVIGTAAALIAVLAVLTVSESNVTPTPRQPAVESTARVTDDVEMATLKSAVAHQYMLERFGVGEVAPSASEGGIEAAVKARIARGYLESDREGSGSGSEKGHPVRRSG